MNTIQSRIEQENPFRVFLQMSGRVFKAYGLSAFVLTKCFPDLELEKEFCSETNEIVYTTHVDIDFTTELDDYEVLVGNDTIEMQCNNQEIVNQIPEWAEEFQHLENDNNKV